MPQSTSLQSKPLVNTSHETGEPPLTSGLEYGLLLAANSLAAFVDTTVDSLADWADDRLEAGEGAANA
ncbi:hypothetical protein PAN31108_00623 [Pandoraea anhela]|uniref:Uncharacterized protein n=1 Tax=Pandoraea anhela TaxID=2508295 RepID=A0A5E4S782_9BURK|nr:hypothetical protein PAN31108_00623 [Pandoraea anhela]